MIYSLDITTPANTSSVDKKLTRMYVTKGLVYKVEVFFPPGSFGLLSCFINDGGYQCWPSTPGQAFIGNNNTIAFDDVYIKNSAPFIFDIFTWNLDETYEHMVIIRLGMVSADIYMARYLPTLAFDLYSEKIAQWEAEQRNEQERMLNTTLKQPFSWME